jgi:hypothetical protein
MTACIWTTANLWRTTSGQYQEWRAPVTRTTTFQMRASSLLMLCNLLIQMLTYLSPISVLYGFRLLVPSFSPGYPRRNLLLSWGRYFGLIGVSGMAPVRMTSSIPSAASLHTKLRTRMVAHLQPLLSGPGKHPVLLRLILARIMARMRTLAISSLLWHGNRLLLGFSRATPCPLHLAQRNSFQSLGPTYPSYRWHLMIWSRVNRPLRRSIGSLVLDLVFANTTLELRGDTDMRIWRTSGCFAN